MSQESLIEVAIRIMENENTSIDVYELIEKVLEEKNIVDTDGTYAAKLYVDIVKSSRFVVYKDEADKKYKIDLKSRKPLDLFDQDGSSFNEKTEKSRKRKKSDDLDDEDKLISDDEDEDDLDDDLDRDEDYDDENSYDDEDYDDENDDEENYDDYEDYDDDEDNYDDENKYSEYIDYNDKYDD